LLTFEYDQEAERRAIRLDGIQEGKRDIIIQMINIGKSIDEISAFIGIPKVELQQLISKR